MRLSVVSNCPIPDAKQIRGHDFSEFKTEELPERSIFLFFAAFHRYRSMLQSIKSLIPLKLKINLYYQMIRLRGALDKGNNVECNICGSHFSRFSDFGSRPSVLCPTCFSLERHRLQYAYLSQHSGIFTDALKVLHFAPEKCLHEKISQNKKLEYETADLLIQFIDIIEVKPKHQMSITDIKFPDNHFDIILCNHVLEHVPDDKKAMTELLRVLKPGGFGILQVPINLKSDDIQEDMSLSTADRAKYYGSPDHLRFYAEKGYMQRLREAGFQVEANPFAQTLDMDRLCLMKTENLIIVRK
jgi:SAM-dependent methyltransferase